MGVYERDKGIREKGGEWRSRILQRLQDGKRDKGRWQHSTNMVLKGGEVEGED